MQNLADRILKADKIMEKINSQHQAIKLQKEMMENHIDEYDNQITQLKENEIKYQKAIEQFKRIADTRSNTAKKYLEDTLNWALAQIPLKQRYKAIINESESSRNAKEMVLSLEDLDTGRIRSMKYQTGTAIAQIVSFLMNVIVIKLSGATRIMVLDEVFTGLQDRETIKIFGNILCSLAEKEHFQFFFVEHKSTLRNVEGIKPIYLDIQNYEQGVIQVNSAEDIISPVANIDNILSLDHMTSVNSVTIPDETTIASVEREVKQVDNEFDINFDDFDI